MKRIALRSTTAAAVALAIAALGTPLSTLSAQTTTLRSGYVMGWGKTESTPATAGQTERTASGYAVTWGKADKTERASSGYVVTWGKEQPVE